MKTYRLQEEEIARQSASIVTYATKTKNVGLVRTAEHKSAEHK